MRYFFVAWLVWRRCSRRTNTHSFLFNLFILVALIVYLRWLYQLF